ncbi:MAG: NAD/NADP octopine/nopaline dehydrogenase family protein [Candidatus Heimdallarchaeota archaeon]|nr:MAG: NAD/NADP octopine/nopaline dehydrogenase family protein [Candidatus Heimdallarchaeota archaeon]
MKNNKIQDDSISILGLGNGGHAFAAYAKSQGYKVKIWNRSRAVLESIKENKGITSSGLLEGHYDVDFISSSIHKVIKQSRLIMVVTTANAHKDVAARITPYLDGNQIVVLNPGRTGGAIEVRNSIRNNNGPFKPHVVEAQSLLFVSRCSKPGQVTISGIKRRVPISAFPSCENEEVVPFLKDLNGAFWETESVLNTSFDNIGAIFHPTPLLLNIARCEDPKVNYRHYIDGVSPSVASFLEKMDKERVAVADAFGVQAITLQKWLNSVYGSSGGSLCETIHNTKEYQNVMAPSTLNVRYIFEDIPTGLIPLSSFGEVAEVPTPFIDAIINLANCMFNKDYRSLGRTVESLELDKIPFYLLKEYMTLGDEFYIEIKKQESVLEE